MKTLANRLTWARNQKIINGHAMTQQELANAAGVSQSTIGNLESEARKTSRKIATIAHALGVDALWLETGKGSPYEGVKSTHPINSPSSLKNELDDAPAITAKMVSIPVVGRVQAGEDGLLHIDEYPPGHGDGYMMWWSSCEGAYALRIRGESMSPRYLPGEYVGVDPCADVTPSDEVIVLMKNGRRMIKRLLWQRDDQVCLESVNKDFQNIVLDVEEIEKLHLVLGNIPKAAFRSE